MHWLNWWTNSSIPFGQFVHQLFLVWIGLKPFVGGTIQFCAKCLFPEWQFRVSWGRYPSADVLRRDELAFQWHCEIWTQFRAKLNCQTAEQKTWTFIPTNQEKFRSCRYLASILKPNFSGGGRNHENCNGNTADWCQHDACLQVYNNKGQLDRDRKTSQESLTLGGITLGVVHVQMLCVCIFGVVNPPTEQYRKHKICQKNGAGFNFFFFFLLFLGMSCVNCQMCTVHYGSIGSIFTQDAQRQVCFGLYMSPHWGVKNASAVRNKIHRKRMRRNSIVLQWRIIWVTVGVCAYHGKKIWCPSWLPQKAFIPISQHNQLPPGDTKNTKTAFLPYIYDFDMTSTFTQVFQYFSRIFAFLGEAEGASSHIKKRNAFFESRVAILRFAQRRLVLQKRKHKNESRKSLFHLFSHISFNAFTNNNLPKNSQNFLRKTSIGVVEITSPLVVPLWLWLKVNSFGNVTTSLCCLSPWQCSCIQFADMEVWKMYLFRYLQRTFWSGRQVHIEFVFQSLYSDADPGFLDKGAAWKVVLHKAGMTVKTFTVEENRQNFNCFFCKATLFRKKNTWERRILLIPVVNPFLLWL